MVNVGLVNLRGIFVLSITFENEEHDICCSALFIASFPEVWGVGSTLRPQNAGRWKEGMDSWSFPYEVGIPSSYISNVEKSSSLGEVGFASNYNFFSNPPHYFPLSRNDLV